MRWRHVFWIVPLLGLLAALAVHLAFFHRTDIRAVIQVDFLPTETSTMPTVSEILYSDAVMRASVKELNLTIRWQTNEDSAVDRLRRESSITSIPGTALIGISHLDFHPATAAEIAEVLARHMGNEAGRQRTAVSDRDLEALREAELRVRSTREALQAALQRSFQKPEEEKHGPLIRIIRNQGPEYLALKSEYETALHTLEQAKRRAIFVWSQRAGVIPPHPLWLHEPPSLSQAFLPAAKRLGIGLFIAVLASPTVAYLLELLFPRKLRPQEIPAPSVSGETVIMP